MDGDDFGRERGHGREAAPVHQQGTRGYAQPAVKCRGPEYLRIIYGPEYLLPGNLERLRARGVGGKRSLASREFALGMEALERFVRKEPLRRTHECVFGVLALESEPVDPRLWSRHSDRRCHGNGAVFGAGSGAGSDFKSAQAECTPHAQPKLLNP